MERYARGRGRRGCGSRHGRNSLLPPLSPPRETHSESRTARPQVKGDSSQRYRFSTIHRGELEYIAIAEDVIPMVDKTPTLSSLALKSQLKGYASEEQWEAVCREYTSLFSSQGLQVTPCEYLPPLLAPLFRFLRLQWCWKVEVNIRVATTSDPRHDWCGISDGGKWHQGHDPSSGCHGVGCGA